MGLARLLVDDAGQAEEVVQDAFVALHRHWSRLREEDAAPAWLRAAVVGWCCYPEYAAGRAAYTGPVGVAENFGEVEYEHLDAGHDGAWVSVMADGTVRIDDRLIVEAGSGAVAVELT